MSNSSGDLNFFFFLKDFAKVAKNFRFDGGKFVSIFSVECWKKRLSLPFSLLLIVIYYHYKWNIIFTCVSVCIRDNVIQNFIQIVCTNKICERNSSDQMAEIFHDGDERPKKKKKEERKHFDSARAHTTHFDRVFFLFWLLYVTILFYL